MFLMIAFSNWPFQIGRKNVKISLISFIEKVAFGLFENSNTPTRGVFSPCLEPHYKLLTMELLPNIKVQSALSKGGSITSKI